MIVFKAVRDDVNHLQYRELYYLSLKKRCNLL